MTEHPVATGPHVPLLQRWSIQKSLVALVSLGLLAGGVLGWTSYQQSRSLIEQAQERGRLALARGLATGLADQLATDDYAGMESRMEQAMADETIASALVIDTEGKVLVHLQRRSPSELPELIFSPQRLLPPVSGLPVPSATNGVTTRWIAIEAGLPVGWLRLRTWSSSTDAVLSLLAKQYQVLGTLVAALVVVMLVISYRQVRRHAHLREQQLQEEKANLERSALTDPLTGLFNRRGIERSLSKTLEDPVSRTEAALTICMIDLDDFKPVNDVYGHDVGDQLLTAVAQRLKSYLRDGDCVGRMGGDEFIAVFRHCPNRDLANDLARRIRHGLSQPFQIGDLSIRIGASVGVVLDAEQRWEPDPSSRELTAELDAREYLENLVKLADQAMYQVKRNGKSQVAIAPRRA